MNHENASPQRSGPVDYSIFFSHGSEDKYVVEHFLKPKLEEAGATVFLDAGEIQYGDDFRRRIFDELKCCNEIVVFFTKSSLLRPWVFAEVGASLIQGKRVVAVRYGPSEADLQKLGVLSLLGTTSVLQLDDFDAYIEQLSARVAEVNDV